MSLTDVFLYFRQKEMRSLVRFISGLQHNISRLVVVVFDAIMRIRTRTGVRPTDFFGGFYMANTTASELQSGGGGGREQDWAGVLQHSRQLGFLTGAESAALKKGTWRPSCSSLR